MTLLLSPIDAPATVVPELVPYLAKAEVDKPAAPGDKWKYDFDVVRGKSTRHTVTREPDFLDEVEGQAVWLADGFAITVPVERLNAFRSYVTARGLSPLGADDYEITRWATAKVTVTRVLEAVLPA